MYKCPLCHWEFGKEKELEMHIRFYHNKSYNNKTTNNKPVGRNPEQSGMLPCPECGSSMIPGGGCWSCPTCGFDKCG